MTNKITEERLEPGFRERLEQLFTDVNSLKARFPPETSSHERIQSQFDEVTMECDGIRNFVDRIRDEIYDKIRDVERAIAEEREI
jgi:hypothetical protein